METNKRITSEDLKDVKFGDMFLTIRDTPAVFVGIYPSYFPKEKRYVNRYLFLERDPFLTFNGIDGEEICLAVDERWPEETEIVGRYNEGKTEEKNSESK